ncbi:phosphatase PAP2 family protein [Propylenella binzhouense]|uniref:Phosphatase PAP2 family protein n=1 Tax=Propylenella binzhouense TaxID=2555902 RepID=A0A964T3X8_9HYPH|nr:phosphatase PAP2 family protein [Propylenella binzhouense]MYZ47859.1 phosphatase PAP2 family protein [Propylenella binzhouense]
MNAYYQAGVALFRRSLALARAEIATLAILLVIAGGSWTFVELAEEVREGSTAAFDRAIILALRNPANLSDPLGPRWFEEMMRDVTALGSTFFITLSAVLVVVYLLMIRKRGAALMVLFSVAGGTLLSFSLKRVFERSRPDLVPHGAEVYTASFPSGHATLSAVTFLTLGVLLTRLEPKRRLKVFFLAVSVGLTLIVGGSRIYLGVHWPTDILAGWALGSAWAMFVWLVALWLQRRGEVEQSVDADVDDGDAPARR